MKIGFVSGLAVAGFLCLGISAPQLVAAVPLPSGLSASTVAPLVTPVKKWNRGRNINRNWKAPRRAVRAPARVRVRGWYRRPYYGRVVAGVALGTIIAASIAPAPPSSEVCWYWTNSSQTKGYWDYCG